MLLFYSMRFRQHEHEFMDKMLETAFHREQSDVVKESVVTHVCEDGTRHIHSDRTVIGVLELSTKWILYGTSPLQVSSGFKLLSTWGSHHFQTFLSYFSSKLVSQMLSDVNNMSSNMPLLLREGFHVLVNKRHTHTYYECAEVVQSNITKCVSSTSNSLLVRNVGLLLEEFKECIPSDEGEAVRFCYAVLNHLRFSDPPKVDASIINCMDDIARILGLVWKLHHQTVLARSLNFIFCTISAPRSERLPEPSCCLAAVVRYIPMEIANLVVRDIVTDSSSSDESIGIAVSHMIGWLRWPCIENMDLWLLCFLTQLAAAMKYDLLAAITEFNVPQLAYNLLDDSPSLWRASFTVLSHMLLSFQHSPEPFHQCLGTMAAAIDMLRKSSGLEPGTPLHQLAMLIYCQMHHYPGFPDLYEPVLNHMQDISPPTPEVMSSILENSRWASQSDSSLLMEGIVPSSSLSSTKQKKLEPGKTGLVNLGNTCYMNSVIQSLYMCDQFRKAVLTKTTQEKENLMEMLQYVFAFLAQSNRPCITPSKFLKASRPSWFLPDHQQDCSEFLKYLLNQLHEDETLSSVVKKDSTNGNVSSNSVFKLNMNKISKADMKKSSVLLTSVSMKMEDIKFSSGPSFECAKNKECVQSLVERYFAGKVQTTLRCLACRQESVTVESFVDISLAFPNSSRLTPHLCKSLAGGSCTSFGELETENLRVVETKPVVPSEDGFSLNDLISFYLKSEKLTQDNKYHCGNCRTLQDGEKSLRIIDSPQYLILTLLRFSYDSKLQTRTKIFKEVHYPCTLSVPVYKQSTSKNTNKCLSGQHARNASNSSTNRAAGVDLQLAKLEDIAKLLAPKCDNSSQEQQSYQLYGLTAVIVHSGTSSECGHYYCYARHSQDGQVDAGMLDEFNCNHLDNLDLLPDKWYCFNDRKVSSCSLNLFRNGIKNSSKDTPYVLIYRKLIPGSQSSAADTEPVLPPGLMDAVIKDNEAYLKEQEAKARMIEKLQISRSSPLNSAGLNSCQSKDGYFGSTNRDNYGEDEMEFDFAESRFMLQ
ncbi:hypothetical protein BsWGS_16077 [Bradybaena similaris]